MKLLVAIVVALALGVAGYFVGHSTGTVRQSTGFTLAEGITPEVRLGVAKTEISEVVEVCPKGGWLIFRGSGRVLLIAANRYHYSLKWQPAEDIKPLPVDGQPGLYDLRANVREVEITMDPEPRTKAYIVDRSLFVDMQEQKEHFKDAMLKRLAVIARNKLQTEQGREQLTSAIRSHLYAIYARESTRVRNIEVRYADKALGAPTPFEQYRFADECGEQPAGAGATAGAAPEVEDGLISVYRLLSGARPK